MRRRWVLALVLLLLAAGLAGCGGAAAPKAEDVPVPVGSRCAEAADLDLCDEAPEYHSSMLEYWLIMHLIFSGSNTTIIQERYRYYQASPALKAPLARSLPPNVKPAAPPAVKPGTGSVSKPAAPSTGGGMKTAPKTGGGSAGAGRSSSGGKR